MENNIFKTTMTNGLILGLIFSVNFLFTASRNVVLMLMTYLLMALIVVLLYRMTKKYRDVTSGGYIKYWKVFNFVVLTFFFSSIISSIFKIIYTQFIDTAYLSSLLEESLKMTESYRSVFERFNMPMDENYYEQLEKQFKPANYAIQGIWINVLTGAIIGLIFGGIFKKEKGLFDDTPSQPEIK
jgi:hypothetical protein